MSKKEKRANLIEEKKETKNKKKKLTLIISGAVLLVVIIGIFLFWFFNRKFEITFDLNNGAKEETVLVKYLNTINKDEVKTKEDLGEKFIDWYEVTIDENGKEVVNDEPFEFNTKIKEERTLRALYVGETEKVTITFDSKGGSNVDSITIDKGEELNMPKNPTKNGYTFKVWETSNKTPIYDKALISEDITLYAVWDKKQEVVKKEETISLSVDNNIIHRRGTKTSSNVKANVENSNNSTVTYSLNNTECATINSSTGVVTAIRDSEMTSNASQTCEAGLDVTVTATLPSGKSASIKITLEKDLYAHFTGSENNNRFIGSTQTVYHDAEQDFTVTANQGVTWNVTCNPVYSNATCTYTGKRSSTATTFVGGLNASWNFGGNVSDTKLDATVKFSTKAGQSLSIAINQLIN